MRRVNVHLDEALDLELAAEAARTGESKASLIRRGARALLAQRASSRDGDPWSSFTGAVTVGTPDDRPDDDVIYGP